MHEVDPSARADHRRPPRAPIGACERFEHAHRRWKVRAETSVTRRAQKAEAAGADQVVDQVGR
jgi:hypothetical protein